MPAAPAAAPAAAAATAVAPAAAAVLHRYTTREGIVRAGGLGWRRGGGVGGMDTEREKQGGDRGHRALQDHDPGSKDGNIGFWNADNANKKRSRIRNIVILISPSMGNRKIRE